MNDAADPRHMALEQDRRIADAVERERSRLHRFIRRRVPDPRDAEDVLQDVFARLVEANRLLMPIDHVTAWLFRVARHRIADLFRHRAARPPGGTARGTDRRDDAIGDEPRSLEALLPSVEPGPDAVYRRRRLAAALEAALAGLPPAQREVFVAHELEGRSFKAIAAETGVGINTLLSRKRYAVLALRARLRDVHDDLNDA
ncbi:MAG: sigma-70 family RNA polymerase sigma factor [Vicinamibacterales bacterium]